LVDQQQAEGAQVKATAIYQNLDAANIGQVCAILQYRLMPLPDGGLAHAGFAGS
jgi:hypothetical protein